MFLGIPHPLPPGSLPPGSAGEGDLWVKTLGPSGQFPLLCSENLLLQPLVAIESAQELASCQHMVTNSLYGGRGRKKTLSVGCVVRTQDQR